MTAWWSSVGSPPSTAAQAGTICEAEYLWPKPSGILAQTGMSQAICQKVTKGTQCMRAIVLAGSRRPSNHSGLLHSSLVPHHTTGSVSFCR